MKPNCVKFKEDKKKRGKADKEGEKGKEGKRTKAKVPVSRWYE